MPPAELLLDRLVGRYRLISLLGEGGAAHTYLARDEDSGARLAVKELRLLKTTNSKQIELFERECAILRELNHPQIPTFVDNVVERRAETLSLYLVQELIEGESLQQALDAGRRFSARETVRVMKSCLAPLDYLHGRDSPLFHRDIKPSNVIQRPDGSCVLVDFGAVREAVLDDRSRGSSVVGTFGYMAPEQFQARAYAATDLYGLAATALHLLTGVEPGRFPLRRLKPEIGAFLRTDPHLTAILDILLEPAAEDRYASTAALRAALERWEDTHGDDPDADRPAPRAGDPARGSTEPRAIPSTVSVASNADQPDDTTSRPPTSIAAERDGTPAGRPVIAESSEEGPAPAASPAPAAPPAQPDGDGTAATEGVPASSRKLTVEDLTEFARREQLPEPLGASPVPAAKGRERRAEPAQQLARGQSGVRTPVVGERAPVGEMLVPGGLGAREVGPLVALVGIGLAAVGWFGPFDYNIGGWLVVGAVLAVYGAALAFTPRRSAGRTSPSARVGTPVEVEVRRVIKRVSPIGRSEWIVDFAYEADDELHYQNRFRLPSAKAAREVALDPSRLTGRFSPLDPGDSVLVPRK